MVTRGRGQHRFRARRLGRAAALVLVFVLVFANGGCSGNAFSEFANKATDKAWLYQANIDMNAKNWTAAIADFQAMSPAGLAAVSVTENFAAAYAGRCGLDLVSLVFKLTGSPSTNLFQVLLSTFQGAAVGQSADCVKAESLLQGLGATASVRSDMAGRLTALEQRLVAVEQEQARPAPRLDRLTARVTALEAQGPATTPAEAAPSDVMQRVAGLEQRLAVAEAAVTKTAARAAQLDAVASASQALAAGKPLGVIPGAPPALARYADSKPPTDASLRQEFAGLAVRATEASKPETEADTMAQRMWLHVRSLVTIKDRDKVLVGAPAAIVLGEAQDRLAAGDLAAAVATLAALDPAAAAIMADWTARAQALLDARAALATLPGAR